jgi:cell division protein FtsB
MFSKQALSSKITVAALFILLVFFAQLKYRQYLSQRQIETQKQTLLAQADSQQKKNNDLNQSLQYLNSSSFKEQVARQQLNLKKDGETVYTFGSPVGQSLPSASSEGPASNAKKWWDYFFSLQ